MSGKTIFLALLFILAGIMLDSDSISRADAHYANQAKNNVGQIKILDQFLLFDIGGYPVGIQGQSFTISGLIPGGKAIVQPINPGLQVPDCIVQPTGDVVGSTQIIIYMNVLTPGCVPSIDVYRLIFIEPSSF